jgi:hypothetical protein
MTESKILHESMYLVRMLHAHEIIDVPTARRGGRTMEHLETRAAAFIFRPPIRGGKRGFRIGRRISTDSSVASL